MGSSQIGAISLLMCVSAIFVHAQPGQTGFLSIDCGADAPHTDPLTTIQWRTDTNFISTGHNAEVKPNNITDTFSELKTIRVFNDSSLPKYCYTLPVNDNSSYTIRTTFFYGDSSPPSFQLALDATVVANVTGCGEFCEFEYTYLARGEVTYLCLVRDGTGGDPFVSAISLRPAVEYRRFGTHLVDNKYIWTRGRYDFGGAVPVRFPTDAHDRYWTPVTPNSSLLTNNTSPIQVLSTAQKINLTHYGTLVPEPILQTALTAQGNITITLRNLSSPNSHLVFHFVELDGHTSSVSRKFMLKVPEVTDVYVNAWNTSRTAFKPMWWYFWGVPLVSETDTINFYPKPRSRLGPLLNAMEVYSVSDVNAYKTLENDTQAIEDIKTSMNLTEWAGDPCLPVPHSWLNCSHSLLEPKVDQVILSGYNLQGTIPDSSLALLDASILSLDNNSFTGTFPNVSSMMALQQLHLHDNQLSGELPDWLATMRSLQVLSIQNNNFSGAIPAELLSKSSLNFTYRPGNPLLIELASTSNSTVSSTGTKPVVFHTAYMFVITVATIMTTLYM